MQAFKETYEAILLNDAIMQVFCEADKAESVRCMVAFCAKMIEEIHNDKDQIEAFWPENKRAATVIKPILERAVRFYRLVLTLFQHEAQGFEDDSDDVIYYLKFSGKDLFEKTLKKLLTADKPDTDAGISAEGSTVLRNLVKDVVKTAASSKILGPKMQTIKQAMDVAASAGQDASTCSDLLSLLVEAAQYVPDFRDGLRKGKTLDFEKSLKAGLLDAVHKIVHVSGDSGTSTITSDQIAKLEKGLSWMEEDQHVLAAQGALKTFATKHNSAIAIKDLMVWATSFSQDAVKNQGSIMKLDGYNQLRDILLKSDKNKKGLPQEVKVALGPAIYEMLKDIVLHVSCQIEWKIFQPIGLSGLSP